jgi:hypothetical protein
MLPPSSGQVAREVVTQTHRRGWANRYRQQKKCRNIVLNYRREMELRELSDLPV